VSDRFSKVLRSAEAHLRDEGRTLRETIDHDGEYGRALEQLLARELRAVLPRGYDVATGFVLTPSEVTPAQQDVVIYDGSRYPAARVGDNTYLFVPESVYALISVKSRLRASDIEGHFKWATSSKHEMTSQLTTRFAGVAAVFSYEFDGDWQRAVEAYFTSITATKRRERLDLICVPGRPVLLDAYAFELADERTRGFGGIAGKVRSFIPKDPTEKPNDMYELEPTAGAFAGMYQLLLTKLSRIQLPPLSTLTLPRFIKSADSDAEVKSVTPITQSNNTWVRVDHRRRARK